MEPLPRPAAPPPGPTPGHAPTPLATGWEELDAVLGGGWPMGALSELCGRGRSSLALGAVSAAQGRGMPVAWVDGSHTFCPATSADVDLERLTLVRPAAVRAGRTAPAEPHKRGRRRGRSTRPLLAADVLLRSRAFGLIVLDAPRGGTAMGPWFRLARLAVRARTVLLLLTERDRSVAGAAATVVAVVGLRPAEVSWEAPGLEVCVRRHRAALPGTSCLPASCCLPPITR